MLTDYLSEIAPVLLAGLQGISLGVADGVGGWVDSGVDPSLFSQALMYHAQRYAKNGWAGEPEIDPTQDYAEREQVEGWELKPMECIDLAHGGVLRERTVLAGPCFSHLCAFFLSNRCAYRLEIVRLKYGVYRKHERIDGGVARRKVRIYWIIDINSQDIYVFYAA